MPLITAKLASKFRKDFMAKPIILILPLSPTLTKLKEVLSQDKEVEFLEAKGLTEAIQHLGARAPALLMTNDPRKCMKYLSSCKGIIKKTSSKTVLITDATVPFKALQKMNQWGLSDHIVEPIAPKTLIYKVNFILRSLPKKLENEDANQEVKFSKDKVDANKDEQEIKNKKLTKENKELENKEGKGKLEFTDDEEAKEKKEASLAEEGDPSVKKSSKLTLDSLEDPEEAKNEDQPTEEEIKLSKKKRLGIDDLLDDDLPEESAEAAPEEENAAAKNQTLQVEGEEETTLADLPDEEAVEEEGAEKGKKLELTDEEEEKKDDIADLEELPEEEAKAKAQLEVSAEEEEEKESSAASPEEEEKKKREKQQLGLEDLEDLDDVTETSTPEEKEKKEKEGKLSLELDSDEEKEEEKKAAVAEDEEAKKQSLNLEVDKDDTTAEAKEKSLEEDEEKEETQTAKLDLEQDSEDESPYKKLKLEEDEAAAAEEKSKEEERDKDARDNLTLDVEAEASAEKEADSLPEEDELKEHSNVTLEVDAEEAAEKENKKLDLDSGEDIYKREKKGKEEDQDQHVAEQSLTPEEEAAQKADYQSLDVEGQEGADWKKREKEIDNDWSYGKDKTDKFDDNWKGRKLDEENVEREKDSLGEQTINYNQIDAEYGESYDKYRKKKKRYGEKEVDSEPHVAEKRTRDKKAKLEIGITEVTKEEPVEEVAKEKDVIFDPSTRGLEFSILSTLLYLNKDIKAEKILSHLAESLFKEKNGMVTFLRSDNPRRVLFSSHESSTDSTPEIKEAWNKLRQELSPGLSEVNLPKWGDHTFTQEENYFIYPLFEGVQELGHAIATFKGGIKTEDDCKLVEVILESSRGIYLNDFHSEGRQGSYEGVSQKAEVIQEEPEKKGFFSGLFKR